LQTQPGFGQIQGGFNGGPSSLISGQSVSDSMG